MNVLAVADNYRLMAEKLRSDAIEAAKDNRPLTARKLRRYAVIAWEAASSEERNEVPEDLGTSVEIPDNFADGRA